MAWIYWDPPRILFHLPFIHHPVAIYGFCFAFGFILGFLIILPMVRRKLVQTTTITERDVASWPILATLFKTDNALPLFSKLSKNTQSALFALKLKQVPNQETRTDILQALNCKKFDRKELESFFPKGLYTLREISLFLTDRLTWFVVAGTIIGARLGHVLFYDWPRYQEHPLDIVKVWEGGLASHGGTLGVMLALFLYQRKIRNHFPELTFLTLLDILSVPTAMTAVWIRLGNFFNQEIVGPVTTVPWAIVFAHPMEAIGGQPRHPAQLYEAFAYLLTFGILYLLWYKKGDTLKSGTLVGLFMIMVFGSRFLIEFVKIPASLIIEENILLTGQYLSLPFIVFGLYLLFKRNNKTRITI